MKTIPFVKLLGPQQLDLPFAAILLPFAVAISNSALSELRPVVSAPSYPSFKPTLN